MNRQTIEMRIEGMSCSRCASVVTEALRKVPGVVKATVDLDTRWALITAEDWVRGADLEEAVAQSGYSGTVAAPSR